MAKPPFKLDADGWLRVRDEWKGSESGSASVAPDLGQERSPSSSGSGPGRLGRSAGPCHWTIIWDADEEEWVAMHRCPEIVVCGAGLDWDEASGACVATGGGSGPTVAPPPPAPPSPPPDGSSGGTSPPPAPPSEPACTDDQIAIAAEYNDPVTWPCTTFTHSVTTGRGTHGHATGYLTDSYISGSGNVLSGVAAAGVTGAVITSDWRCPTGNSNVGATGLKHVHGRAGDFWAPGFLAKADGAGATPAEEKVARALHAEFVTAAVAAGRTGHTPFGYDGTHKDHIHIYW
ncbi:MAG: hypothetical protein F4X22_15910 [Gemmatimonadales bacterium]|nr:hypothetical protein [Candidatus Palauibacter denitrificans]